MPAKRKIQKEDILIIERMISKDYSFASIGRNLERSASTISREVIKYRCFVDRIPLPGENDCTHKNSCLRFVILTFLKRLFTGNVGLKRFLPSLNTNIDKVAPMKISNPSWKQTHIYLL